MNVTMTPAAEKFIRRMLRWCIKSDSELQALRADFLEWTGGFEPETDEQIATYLEGSMAVDIDPGEARDALRGWMRAAAISR